MTYEDDRQRQVRTGQAINLAVELAVNEMLSEDAESVLARARELVDPALELVNTVQTQAAFPGSTSEPYSVDPTAPVFVRNEPGGPVAPAPAPVHLAGQQYPHPDAQQTPPPPPAPAPIPGVTDGDPLTAALWTEFFNDPSKFWDNRADKASGNANPRSPDFKHKDDGDKALWIIGKKNPSWVQAQLQARGLS